ncbi:hypothetical protein [Phenylobacterium sp.]|uniref:hypothetical protein n=1 Tax=Phenylobacterium sp. TaxID=1871053 RepID=UPI002B49BB77|nr:hypothetical protein [Phenylobacterium sp.]
MMVIIIKEILINNFSLPVDLLESPMRMVTDRAVLTVLRHEGAWAVELDGELFGRSRDQEGARAAANRRVREIQDSGRACQVRVSGEIGFYPVP